MDFFLFAYNANSSCDRNKWFIVDFVSPKAWFSAQNAPWPKRLAGLGGVRESWGSQRSPNPLTGFRGGGKEGNRDGKGKTLHFPNRSPPLPTAVAKDGIKKSSHCFETITQLPSTPLENSWLRHWIWWWLCWWRIDDIGVARIYDWGSRFLDCQC